MDSAWLVTAAAILAIWGTAHLVSTPRVIASLHPDTPDTRRVITMEWLNEGLTLLFIAALLIGVVVLAADDTGVSGDTGRFVLGTVVVMLNVMSAISLATGFRVRFIAYRLCPAVFTGSSLLVVAALL